LLASQSRRLQITDKSSVSGFEADGFVSFAPKIKTVCTDGPALRVSWLDKKDAQTIDFATWREQPDFRACGMLEDGWIVLRFTNE